MRPILLLIIVFAVTKTGTSQIISVQKNTDTVYQYEKEASFPGGHTAWIEYLKANLKTEVPANNKAPKGKYEVIIAFKIDTGGTLANIKPKTHLGYGMEEEAIRVLKNSPKWIPGTLNGKPVNAYREQAFWFVVE
jgi:hypothetical protein